MPASCRGEALIAQKSCAVIPPRVPLSRRTPRARRDARLQGSPSGPMKSLFTQDFGQRHLMIGMVHTAALPGAPGYDRSAGMRPLIEHVRSEALVLADSG